MCSVAVACLHVRKLSLDTAFRSQHKLHQNFGGVVPSLARQAHQDRIDEVVEEALSQAGLLSVECVSSLSGLSSLSGQIVVKHWI